MIVRTLAGLQSLTTPPNRSTWNEPTSINLYGNTQAYGEIYKRQPNVRTMVDFLSRAVAHLGLPVFRRHSDTDRERLIDHDLARWLAKPNPTTSEFRLKESLMGDLGIYFNAYWAKVRFLGEHGRPTINLVRLPPEEMSVEGGLLPTHYVWTVNGRRKEFALSEVVYFNGYNPLNTRMGLSPLATLHRVLAEEAAAGEHREAFWRNSARIDGIVTRPATKPKYNPTQLTSWREQWQAAYGGGLGAGRTVLLQEGETFTPAGWSPKDAEYLSARKLTTEECARAYQIPLPLVGILEHATFSNIKEQHKHLYADCLGPWLEMIQQEIERQLLPDCADNDRVYTEFNIQAKLAGSFEEQAASLQVATGRPWMTANEARAKQNLPQSDDPSADKIAAQQGGPSATAPRPMSPSAPSAPSANTLDVDRIIQAHRARQTAWLASSPAGARADTFALNADRWDRELADDLAEVINADTHRLLRGDTPLLGEPAHA